MRKELPKIYINKVGKKNNNREIYYSYKDDKEEIIKTNILDIQNKIDDIFKSSDFIYKNKVHIKTKYSDKDYIIISKNMDYLLTIDGEKIFIANIIDINKI